MVHQIVEEFGPRPGVADYRFTNSSTQTGWRDQMALWVFEMERDDNPGTLGPLSIHSMMRQRL
jgi:hypothetical protein